MHINFKRNIDTFFGLQLIFLNVVLYKLVKPFIRRDHSISRQPDRILFIKMLGMGSVIIAADSINALKKKYPHTQLVLMCNPAMRKGIEPLELFDDFWIIDDKGFFSTVKTSLRTLLNCWRTKRLWVIDLEIYSKLTTIFSLWTLATNRFGFYLNLVRFRNNLYTHLCYFNVFKAVRENYNRLARTAGAEDFSYYILPAYPLENRPAYRDADFIAINNTCSGLSLERKLKPKQLQNIITFLLEHTDKKIALVGAPSDKPEMDETVHQFVKFNDRVQNVAGKYNFNEYYNFLYESCAFMISIDSFPLHIARRLGLPTFSLWGPTNPENYHSFNPSLAKELNTTFYLFSHCSPCVHHTNILPCKGNNICILKMKDQQIFVAIEKLLIDLKKEDETILH